LGKPSYPDPTPPDQTAAAQVSQNIGTSIANSYLNNVNQVGPDGTKTYDITGYKDYVDNSDPDNPVTYQIPQYSLTESLTGMGQKIKDQTDQAKLGLGQLANQQTGFLQDYMSKPFQYNEGQHEKWALGLYDKLNRKDEQRSMEDMRAQLANQGVKLGSDSYGDAMQDLMTSRSDSRNRFALDSYQTGLSSAMAQRNQPINEIGALLSQGQVSMPQFGPTNSYNIPTVDQAGITANYDNLRMQQAQAEAAARGQLIGGLFSFGSSLLSDKRAKTDIEDDGSMQIEGDDGEDKTVGLFRYRYKGEPKSQPKHRGVMAQEVAKKKPSAVSKRPDGLMAVNYSRLKKG
jgi:hypothetical protein